MMSVANAVHSGSSESIRFVKRTASAEGAPMTKTALRKSRAEPWVRVSTQEIQAAIERMVDPSVVIEYKWWLGKRRRFTVKWQDYHLVTLAAKGELKLPANARVIVAEHVRYR